VGIESQARSFGDDEVATVKELLHQRRKDLTELNVRIPRARSAVELKLLRKAKEDAQAEVDECVNYLREHAPDP